MTLSPTFSYEFFTNFSLPVTISSQRGINFSAVYRIKFNLTGIYLLALGNDRGVTPHSIDQSNQFRSRALWSIEHERVHDFHSKQFSCQQPFNQVQKHYIDMDD